MPCLLAARVWNRLPSFVNFKCAFAYPMPSLTLGAACAMQYSITIATTLECVAGGERTRHTEAAAADYAQHKELHLDTAQACAAQGVKFMPMVAECTGAWAPEALKVLKHVAHAARLRTRVRSPQSAMASSCRSWPLRSALSGRGPLFAVGSKLFDRLGRVLHRAVPS